MAELSQDEFWLIQVYFHHQVGLGGSHDISDVNFEMMRLQFFRARDVIGSLVDKNVLSLSPDGNKVKFTDYGIELFRSMLCAQKDWDAQPIVKVSNLDRGQILIRAGETFKGNRVLREIFALARRELCIIDPYVGTELFDILNEFAAGLSIRIITVDKLQPPVLICYRAFRQQFGHTEMRVILPKTPHDRFILIDGAKGFHVGHSLKDLGKKDTQLDPLLNPTEQVAFFGQRWLQSKPLTP